MEELNDVELVVVILQVSLVEHDVPADPALLIHLALENTSGNY